MKIFSKPEKKALIIIFSVLIVVAIPNFAASLRRARDQVRRDDLGSLVHSLDEYVKDMGFFPPSSPDGKIMACLAPGDVPYQDTKGNWVFNPVICDWGKDSFTNVISHKEYISVMPRDPNAQEGASYLYLSDGKRYQIYAAMEGKSEAEVSQAVIDKNLSCGNRTCNVARTFNCDVTKTILECQIEEEEALKK